MVCKHCECCSVPLGFQCQRDPHQCIAWPPALTPRTVKRIMLPWCLICPQMIQYVNIWSFFFTNHKYLLKWHWGRYRSGGKTKTDKKMKKNKQKPTVTFWPSEPLVSQDSFWLLQMDSSTPNCFFAAFFSPVVMFYSPSVCFFYFSGFAAVLLRMLVFFFSP